jgi:FkbM family methyltransferase
MNLVRLIHPLWLRQKLTYRFVARTSARPHIDDAGYALALAPVRLRSLDLRDISHRQIAWMGIYELPLSRQLARLARRSGGLLVDVGANVGYFSCLWTSINSRNRCIAFEASPRNQEMLAGNVASAGLNDRIEVRPYALGRVAGELPFDVGPADQTGWGGLATAPSARTVTVPVHRLDDVLDPRAPITVLKVDVEGADAWVLEGAERLLRARQIEHVFFEQNPARMRQLGIDAEYTFELMRKYGYEVKPLAGTAGEFHATPAQGAGSKRA